jgi:hypothetical protein
MKRTRSIEPPWLTRLIERLDTAKQSHRPQGHSTKPRRGEVRRVFLRRYAAR